MREGWVTQRLGDIALVGAGNSAPQDKVLFVNGKYPFFRTSDVGRIHIGTAHEAEDQLNEKGIQRLTLYPAGTILLPKSGASTFLDHRVMLGVDGYVSSHLATVRAKSDIIDTTYLFYFLLTVEARSLGVDTAYPTLSLAQVNAINIALPPLPEQQRIVALLDEVFAGLATATANAEKNLKNARELFDGYLDSFFARKGAGWIEKTIGEICELKSGTTVDKKLERAAGDIPYLKVADMTFAGNGERIFSSSRFLNNKDVKAAQIMPVGTTIFPKRGGAILTNKKRLTAVPICADLNIMGVLPSDTILPELMFMYFLSVDMRELGSGSSIPQINNYDIAPLNICFPEHEDAQAKAVREFEEYQAATKELEGAYRRKLDDLIDLKRSILQKAFSGELTAPPSQAIKEAAE